MMCRTSIFALSAAAMTFAAAGVNIAVKVSVDSRIGSVSLNPSLGPYTGGHTYESESWQGDTAFTITANNVSVGYTAYWEIVTNDVRASSGGIGTAITIPSTPHRPGTQTSVYAGCTVRFYVTANTYTVNLNQEGGSGGSSSVPATYGAAMPSATMPTKTGYAFGGYYTGTSGSGTQYYKAGGTSARSWNIASATTLYAKWTANSYKVTLKANSNQSVWPLINATFPDGTANDKWFWATYDQKYPTLVGGVPSSPGYTFKNWYDGTSGTGFRDGVQLNDLTVKITRNSTFFAQWTANTYTLTLQANGNQSVWPHINATFGGGTTTKTTQMTYGQKYPVLASSLNPSSRGYTFAGWWNPKTGAWYSDNAQVRTAANHDIYAQWTTNSYNVTLDRQSGSGGSSSVTAKYGQPMPSITKPTRTGHTFGGYYTGQNGSGTQYYTDAGASARWCDIDTANSRLYAKWTANTYTVTFNVNASGGSVSPATKSVTYGSTYGDLPTPTFADHVFAGWFTAASGGERVTSATSVSITSTQTLYAHWTQASYEVRFKAFDKNGTEIGGNSQTIGMGVSDYLQYFSALNIMSPNGYSFAEWNTAQDGSAVPYEDHAYVYNLTNVPNAIVTLYAQWEPNPYEIAFQPNGADGGTMANLSCTYDVPTDLPACGFTRTGYAFEQWSSDTNYNNHTKYYPAGAVVTNLAMGGVVDLYANWTGNVYTVTFDANATNYLSGSMDPITCVYDVPTNLPPCGFTRDGWGFKGWTNSLAEGVLFADKARVTNLTTTAEVTMLACWTGVTYQVTLDARDPQGNGVFTNDMGVAVCVWTTTNTVGEAWNLPTPTNANENLEFAGWKYGDNQTASGEVPPPSTGSTNLVAAWSWKTDDLAAAVDAPELGFRTFGTVGDQGKPDEAVYSANWFAQTDCFFDDGDGVSTNAVQSGALPAKVESDNPYYDQNQAFVSWLITEVKGKGVLSFRWKCDAQNVVKTQYAPGGWAGDIFLFGLYDATAGITNEIVRLTNQVDWCQVVYTNKFESAISFAWAFVYADDNRSNGGGTGWVDRVTWVQEGSSSEATPEFGVPYSWLREKFEREPPDPPLSDEELNAIGDGPSPNNKSWPNGDPVMVWQDYLAGTNPNDPDDLFHALIAVTNGVPTISWQPDLSVTGDPKRVYKVLCAPSPVLADSIGEHGTPDGGGWVEWPGPGAEGPATNRFFKVELDWEASKK